MYPRTGKPPAGLAATFGGDLAADKILTIRRIRCSSWPARPRTTWGACAAAVPGAPPWLGQMLSWLAGQPA